LAPATVPPRPPDHGVTVWFAGLPSAGKTTIAGPVGRRLAEQGRRVELLDGDEVRAAVERVGGFVEVHIATDLATCRARDVKGLYARHARGELHGLTGVDDPFEPPLAPELALDTADESPGESAARVLALLGAADHAATRRAAPTGALTSQVARVLVDGYRAAFKG
jgi:adenylylsulfate kinase